MSGCVQGMEVAIVSDLIMSGALAHIDNVHVDWPLFTLSDKVAAHYLLDTVSPADLEVPPTRAQVG